MNEIDGGLEFCKDEQIKRGLVDWPNQIREGPAQTNVLAKIDVEIEKSHSEKVSQDASLPFPPGWGPDPTFKKVPLDICESENPVLRKGNMFYQGNEEPEESIPYPPGWGPEIRDGSAPSEGVEGSTRLEVEAEVVTESEKGINSLGSGRQDLKIADEMGGIEVPPDFQNPTQTEGNLVSNCSTSGERNRLCSLGGNEARGGRKPRAVRHKKNNSKKKRIRLERVQLRSFFSDLQSPRAQEARKGRQENRSRAKVLNAKAEAEEVAKLGEQIGVRCNLPRADAVRQIEEMMGGRHECGDVARRGEVNFNL